MHYRYPMVTGGLVFICMVIFFFPDLSAALIYDRELILAGEYWRLLTGHLVHYSLTHLLLNILLLFLAGMLLEQANRIRFVWLSITVVVLLSCYAWFFMPGMQLYAGISGLVTALVAYYSLQQLKLDTHNRPVWIWLLLGLVGKITFELFDRHTFFVTSGSAEFVVTAELHALALLIAVSFYVYWVQQYRSQEDMATHSDRSITY